MGIHGLMSYVEEHEQFFVDLHLRNTKIIIDGNNLYHRLYFDAHLDMRHGGDYDSFTAIAYKFFETLTLCNIRPYVVLDGGSDASDKKFTTLRERAQEKIRSAYSLSYSGNGCVIPLLIREVFKQILAKLQVPFVQSISEADRDIVSLANYWNCPVLTFDSDFCIFDLKAGFCPLNHFQWRYICTSKESQDCYIAAKCFSLERFCNHFSNMNKTLLPLFAVMSGNDYIKLPVMEVFFSKVHLPVGGYRNKGKKHTHIQGLLNWLSCFPDPAEAIEHVLKYLKKEEKEETRQLLCTSMEEYEPSDVNLENFFQNGFYESEAAKKLELPQWILNALAKGLLAPFISDALVLRRTILHTQVENMQRPSSHDTDRSIRQVIYGLLLDTSKSSFHASMKKHSTSSTPMVREFDRFQKVLRKSFVHAATLPGNFCSEQYSLATLNEIPLADRLELLLETLGVTASILEPVPSWMQLPMAVTCFWIRHSEPKVKLQHMKALLLGIVFGELHKILQKTESEVLHSEVNKIVYDQFLKWKDRKSPNEVLELNAAHVFCQWQSCLQTALYLNQLLSTPLPEPDLTRLYNGTLVHRLYHELRSVSTPEKLVGTSPMMNQLYCNMLYVVRCAIPTEFFQKKKAKSHKKKKNQAAMQELDKREGPTVEVLPSCSINNRFTTFMKED